MDYALIVEKGPDAGKRFPLSREGVSVGRASQNAVALTDSELSRQHCRLEFRGEALWVADMASANGTRVNGAEVREAELKVGDTVEVGASVLRVENVGQVSRLAADSQPASQETCATLETGATLVDLGLSSGNAEAGGAVSGRHVMRLVLTGVATVGLLLALAVAGMFLTKPSAPNVAPLAVAEALQGLEVHFVKLEGSPQNVFRYELSLSPEGVLRVAIDDVVQSRHVRRESERPVPEAILRDVTHAIEQLGFFALEESLTGVPRENMFTQADMTVVSGVRAKRVRILNRPEPEAFRTVRERLETFARNELGLWAVEFSKEQLEAMAEESLQLARRRVMEREIKTGNLFEATQKFRECMYYLETVEPKPDFYDEAARELRAAEKLLTETYETWNVDADRFIKLKEWERATEVLRRIMEWIPNQNDERYRDAERRLLDVEARLRALKKRR